MLCAHASVYADWSDQEEPFVALAPPPATNFDRLGGMSQCCGHTGQGPSAGRELQQHVHVSQKIENKRAVYSR